MKNPQESTKSFSTLMRKLRKKSAPPPEPQGRGDPIEVLVKSFLMWDATSTKAAAAYRRIMDEVVDFNDLRVTMPHEIVEWIGPRYPRALERSRRLRAALRHTYKREHAVSLERLCNIGRREVKQYLRSLDGIAPYVADRVTLLCFDAHCIPVDDRLRRALISNGVCDETVDVADLASWLARQVKAADAPMTHYTLQEWSDQVGSSARTRSSSKTTRKKTARSGR